VIARPHSFVLDAEALSALAFEDRRMQVWATVARRTDSVIYASAATLAEVTDGSARDARVHRAVKALRLVEVNARIGYLAGQLRATAAALRPKRRDLTVDALVAATALTLTAPVIVLTSDRNDMSLLLGGREAKVEAI
jgi:predicted nucleic acid-binding protein